ncbi:MAG TPA: efflux RND transporter periplasmic adaptor subunit [Terriglobales bacterium]|nr:efflux RND transporter periplasmic adaptor subunit [Terriglobales bacterium]
MNLAEALVQALPELPTQVVAKRKFKFNPDLIVRDEIDDNGQPIKVVFVPEKGAMYYLEQPQFDLFKLFDGERDIAEVAQAYLEQTGTAIPEEDVKGFALASVDTGLWYESAQERNITLSQKLKDERTRRVKQKGKFSDLSHIIFKGWDPDKFLTWVHEKLWFIYTPWFTALTMGLFAFMTWIWVSRWSEIGRDTLLYYTFTQKSASDLLEFWLLFLFMAFFHESAHGLTAKHYGASVHNMGFQLIYLAPAFAIEITELWARVGRRERLWAIIAGVWIEMVFCAIATIIWWGTPGGTMVHEWSYKLMMITGLVVLVVNMNPLMKLDGYYALAEIVGVSELKERSTAFVSGWVKKHVFRLPVEYDYVPPRRRWLFVPYALLSGAYSYLLLFAVSRFTYNVFHRFTPEWAFVPAGLVAWKIFKSRILRFGAFMKTVFLHNLDELKTATSPTTRVALLVGLAVVLIVPVFHKTANGVFVLEPVEKAVVRAKVPGFVERMYVEEQSQVQAGAPIAQMRNLEIEGELAKASAELEVAKSRYVRAQLQYASLGSSQAEFNRAESVQETARSRASELLPSAPIAGVVTTPRPRDLEKRYVEEGTELATIENLGTMRARLYLPEYQVREIHAGAPVSVRMKSRWSLVKGQVDYIGVAPSDVPPGLMAESKYSGLRPPAFYVVDVRIANPGDLKTGMSGEAKIILRNQSLFGKFWGNVKDFAGRRLY